MFDAGDFVLIPINDRLQCQWLRPNDRMALEFHSRAVRGGCHCISPEYAYLGCVYRVVGLLQDIFLERGSKKTLVFGESGETTKEMTGHELAEYRDQQPRNTTPSKARSGSGTSRKRQRSPDDAPEDVRELDQGDCSAEFDIDSGIDDIDTCSFPRGRRRTRKMDKLFQTWAARKRLRIS